MARIKEANKIMHARILMPATNGIIITKQQQLCRSTMNRTQRKQNRKKCVRIVIYVFQIVSYSNAIELFAQKNTQRNSAKTKHLTVNDEHK